MNNSLNWQRKCLTLGGKVIGNLKKAFAFMLDEELSEDLQMIVEDPSNAASVKDEFKCIFWDQQVCSHV